MRHFAGGQRDVLKVFCAELCALLSRERTPLMSSEMLRRLRHDSQAPAPAFLHELLSSFMQSLRIRIINKDTMIVIYKGEAFRLASMILDGKCYPKSILYRNINQIVYKTIDAVY